MQDLSQDPLTKYLVKFCEKGYHLLKQLNFNDVLSLANITEDFRKFSIQAYVSGHSIDTSSIIDLSEKLNCILQRVDETKRLIVIFQVLSIMIQYLELDIDFRKASRHYKKDLMKSMLNINTFTPFVKNKKYTDLILHALHVDLMILHDGESPLAIVENFLKDLEILFDDLRKESYKDLSQKIKPLKEDLLAAVMHPSRIEKMLDSGVSVEEITEIYCV